MDDVDDAGEALYGLKPQEFTAQRDAAAKAARAAGDRPGAAAIAALRKPTVSAWLMNLLVREDAELAPQLTALADGLRAAEASLDGEQLRDLNRQRRQLVASLSGRARRLGAAAGQRVGDAVVQELDRTLKAALADPAVTAEVLSGRLTGPREYAGFGAATAGGPHLTIVEDSEPGSAAGRKAPAAGGQAPARDRTPRPRSGRLTVVDPSEAASARRDREREQARAAAEAAARAESERAHAALLEAHERKRLAQDTQASAERELVEWQTMAATARTQLERAERELRTLAAAVDRARSHLGDAEQRADRASDGLATARDDAKRATAAVRSAGQDVVQRDRALAKAVRPTSGRRDSPIRPR